MPKSYGPLLPLVVHEIKTLWLEILLICKFSVIFLIMIIICTIIIIQLDC